MARSQEHWTETVDRKRQGIEEQIGKALKHIREAQQQAQDALSAIPKNPPQTRTESRHGPEIPTATDEEVPLWASGLAKVIRDAEGEFKYMGDWLEQGHGERIRKALLEVSGNS